MPESFKNIFVKAKWNFLVLATILILVVLGKLFDPVLAKRVLVIADSLISELVPIFIAIALGALIPDFKLLVLGTLVIFSAAIALSFAGIFAYLTPDYFCAILIVILSFAAIANLYRRYREF
jgi:hypothetical protein